MSRYHVKPKEEYSGTVSEIAVGYDAPLGGYFCTIMGHADESGNVPWVEPWQPIMQRYEVLRLMVKYCDSDDKLTNQVINCLAMMVDPASIMKVDTAHYKDWQ